MKRSIKGITIVELVVVVVIIAILVAVAIPMMRASYKTRAILTEASIALGAIRALQRLYYVDNRVYAKAELGGGIFTTDPGSAYPIAELPGINVAARDLGVRDTNYTGDLDGTYFSQECYSIYEAPLDGFGNAMAICYVNDDNNVATKSAEAAGIALAGEYGYIIIDVI